MLSSNVIVTYIIIIALVSTNDLRIVASLKVHILCVAVVLEGVFGENTTLVKKKVNNKEQY